MKCGPISRESAVAVSGSSGKLTQNPKSRAEATAIICSPIQASGRKETNSSPADLGSYLPRLWAMDNRFRWDSTASLGRPVVPEVVAMRHGSSGLTLRDSSRNRSTQSLHFSRPRRRTELKLHSPWTEPS